MNRKLINGLLLLTVATGGVGTFTSCKDNEEGYEIKKDQAKLFDILDEKIKNGDENLKVVKDKLNALLDAGLLTKANQDYLESLIKNNENYSTALKSYVDDMVMNLITNVQIEEVYNPAFGTINLPLGIQNGLLCNYYYQSDHAVQFPIANGAQYAGMGIYGDPEALDALDKAKLKPKNDEVKLGTEVQDIDRLGEIYVTINPASIPEKALQGLVITMRKTNGEQVLGTFEAVKEDNHVKNFGYTRAGNGFYKIKVGVDASEVTSINLNLDDNLKAAAKDFVKNPSKSDLLGLAEAIYKQFNNRIPALGLRFDVPVTQSFVYDSTPWNPIAGPGVLVLPNVTVDPETGKYILNGNTPGNQGELGENEEITVDENKKPTRTIISPYDIAAVTYHPLSYSFDPEGYVPDRRLPQIGHIQEYVDRVLSKADFSFELNGQKYGINLDKVQFTVEPTKIKIDLSSVKDSFGKPLEGTLELGYDGGKVSVPGDNSTALNDFVQQIINSVNGDGNDKSFVAQIQAQVNTELQKIVNDINSQVKTQITDKINNIKEEINNELSGRLGDGINRLIDLYNKIAQKVNNILDDPNAYMQIYAAYRDGDGDLHHLSTVASDPSIFTKGTGDAITLFLTSYNGELLAPAYKKYIAVVKDLDGGDITNANNASELNKVLDGRQQKAYVAVNDLTPGHTYQLVYTALDYRGNVSARSFYIKVAE